MVVLLVSAKGSDGSEAEELLGGPLVRLRDVDHRALLVVLAAAARRGRGGERGAGLASGLHPAQLAAAGQLEPLLRTRVRLHLGHGVSLPLLRVVWGAARASIRLRSRGRGSPSDRVPSSAPPRGRRCGLSAPRARRPRRRPARPSASASRRPSRPWP